MTNNKEFKEKLEVQKALLMTRLEKINSDLTQENRLSKDSEERATETENDEVLIALKQESAEELQQINNALARIENNQFGLCLQCQEPIPEERLQIVPYTKFCINCINEIDKK